MIGHVVRWVLCRVGWHAYHPYIYTSKYDMCDDCGKLRRVI